MSNHVEQFVIMLNHSHLIESELQHTINVPISSIQSSIWFAKGSKWFAKALTDFVNICVTCMNVILYIYIINEY